MFNRLAKFLLVATSLSPILGAVAVNQYAIGKPLEKWLPWLVVALLLILICWLLLHYAAHHAQKQKVRIEQFENNDKEVLAFLLAYLAAGYEVDIQLDGDKIVFPADKPSAKRLLLFLNEELFRGAITEKLYETNSKREAD